MPEAEGIAATRKAARRRPLQSDRCSREASARSEEVTNAELEALRLAAIGRSRRDRRATSDREMRFIAVVQLRNRAVQRRPLGQVVLVRCRCDPGGVRVVERAERVGQFAAVVAEVDFTLAHRDDRVDRSTRLLQIAQCLTIDVAFELDDAEVIRAADVVGLLRVDDADGSGDRRDASRTVAVGLGTLRSGGDRNIERAGSEAESTTDVAPLIAGLAELGRRAEDARDGVGAGVATFAGCDVDLAVEATDVRRQVVADHVVGADVGARGQLLDELRMADTDGAEGIEQGLVPERRRVVAAKAKLAGVAEQADGGTAGLELARARSALAGTAVAGVSTRAGEKHEAGFQAATEILDALETKLAAVDAVLVQAQTLVGAVVLDVAAVQVDRAVQRDRRLRRRSGSKSAQYRESEQRFFHCDYLLG